MKSGAIRDVPFDDLARRLDVRQRRVPFEGTLETTYRCNLRCAHCYVNEAVGDAEEASRELPLERLLRLVDEIAERGTLYLLLTGGEVLVRPDFPELYLYSLRRGLLVTVFTNGTLITDRIADLLAEHPPYNLEISLYGMTRETYEKVTQVPGSFDKCLAGIERLRARGVRFKLKTMALSWNAHEVPAMAEYAHSLGVRFRFDSHLNPRVDCGANRNSELQLSAERSVALDMSFADKAADLREFSERHLRPDPERGETQFVYNCGAGQMSFTIDPYGHLQMCQLSRRRSIDVRDQQFAEAWDRHMPALRERRWTRPSACRSCNLIALCASCPGAAEMETGDAESIVPVFCEITHLRAWASLGEGSGHRRDATCCLGTGRLASQPGAEGRAERSGCGSCGHAAREDRPLLQIERRRPLPA